MRSITIAMAVKLIESGKADELNCIPKGFLCNKTNGRPKFPELDIAKTLIIHRRISHADLAYVDKELEGISKYHFRRIIKESSKEKDSK